MVNELGLDDPKVNMPCESRLVSRLVSIDVFRGGVMLLMLAEVLHLCHLARAFPDSQFAQWLCYHQSHVEWRGCSIHDLIQPGFSFLVGTALAFSIANRRQGKQSNLRLLLHAAWRALVLVGLGVFLRSLHHSQTYWTFEDTLSQIGLGYFPLVIIALLPRLATWLSISVLLLGYFTAFALTPLPAPNFDTTAVGVPAAWEHWESGFAAHWNKNTNLATRFDQWFLNLFPREKTFVFNSGGYATLSFIPTLATMLLGLVAGRWLRDSVSSVRTLAKVLLAGTICLALGYVLDAAEVCISVKRIWTPAWVLVSGGWSFLILGGLYLWNDVLGWKRLAFPFIVVGMNSIAAYVLSWFAPEFISESLTKHLGDDFAKSFGDDFASLVAGGITLLVLWLILFWMYRRKLFLKI